MDIIKPFIHIHFYAYAYMSKITFQSVLLLFRMKIVLDLECLIEEHINKSASVVPLINGLALYITTNYLTNPDETAKVVDNGANQPKGIRITISRAWNYAVLFVNLPFRLSPHSTCTYLSFSFSFNTHESRQPNISCPMSTMLRYCS